MKKMKRNNIKGGNFNNWVNDFMAKTNKDINRTIEDLKNVTGNSIQKIENKDLRDFLSNAICDDIEAKNQAQNTNDTCPNVSNLPDDEIRTIAQNLAERVKQNQSNYPQQNQQYGKLQRTANFNIQSNNYDNYDIESENTNISNEFDTNSKFYEYNQIHNEMIELFYNLLLQYKANNDFSYDKELKTLMSKLVLVEKAFGILRRYENKFNNTFINILHIIKNDCSNAKYFVCWGAATFASAQDLFNFLRKESNVLDRITEDQYHLLNIDENVLSKYINHSIPVILNKIGNIQMESIQSIVIKIISFSNRYGIAQTMGGKAKDKKPRMIKKKNILGKERSVYKVHGTKKECVNYKNSFIPVSEFILMMKTRKDKSDKENNSEHLSIMLTNIVLTNKTKQKNNVVNKVNNKK